MRTRGLWLVAALAAALVGVAAAPSVHASVPAGCRDANSDGIVEYCNQIFPASGPRGSIALLGDSVLMGSANGMSNPGLPSMLIANGWGSVRLTATLGMKTYDSRLSQREASAWHWIDSWYAGGYHPAVIALNLGANHLGTCTPSTVSVCKAQIDMLLDKIGPDTKVWWAEVLQQTYPQRQDTAGMLGWNMALQQAAAQRPNLVLWDWPAAFAAANPPIAMDVGNIHPASGPEYVKRSKLMLAHINAQMGQSLFVGPAATLPSPNGSPLTFHAFAPFQVYASTDTTPFADGTTRQIDTSAVASTGTRGGLVLTIGAYRPGGAGFLSVYPTPCVAGAPPTSSLNYTVNTFRTAQVVTRVGDDGDICVYASKATDVIIWAQGELLQGAADRLTPITPVRATDTRQGTRSADIVVPLPDSVPADASAVAITLTATRNSAGGILIAYACGAPVPSVATSTYLPSETVAAAAFVPVGTGKTICVHIAPTNGSPTLTDVIVDVTGFFSPTGSLAFQPAGPQRLLDTRYGTGGWQYQQGRRQTLNLPVAPPGAAAVTGSVTMVRPAENAYEVAFACDQALPATSAVNAFSGAVVANSVTVGVSATQQLCLFTSNGTDVLFDVVGWWVAPT